MVNIRKYGKYIDIRKYKKIRKYSKIHNCEFLTL